MWMTLASLRGWWLRGIHGTTLSITITTSALGRNSHGLWPRCMGWSVGRFMSRASACTTGMANCSANAASAPTAAGTRPTLEVTISGNSALAIRLAASSIAARAGSGARAPKRPPVVRADLAGGATEHLARQREVDWSARLGHGDVQRPVDHGFHRLAGAQLIVPFHVFAQHAALVERLLAPVDRAVARGDAAGLGDRGAPGGEQH